MLVIFVIFISNICDIAIICDIFNTLYIIYLRKVPDSCFKKKKKMESFKESFFSRKVL